MIKEALGDDVEYNPWGRINPGSMVFPFFYNTTADSDHIKAVYNGLNIELGDIELIDGQEDIKENGQTEETRITHFKWQLQELCWFFGICEKSRNYVSFVLYCCP